MTSVLLHATAQLAEQIAPLDTPGLERAWAYFEYDEEGVRFAALQSALELRMLAVRLAAHRSAPTQAERIMGQYQVAYRTLRGALLGLTDAELDIEPTTGEWTIRIILQHMMEVALSFHSAILTSLDVTRKGEPLIPDALMEPFVAHRQAVMNDFALSPEDPIPGPLSAIMAVFDSVHARLIADLATLPDAELELPSVFWETTPYPVRFRMHRFTAHLIQHTFQIEKATALFGKPYTEARALASDLYIALGEVEAALIGTVIGADFIQSQAETFQKRNAEIGAALGA